jgi:hypothetical protein
MSDTLTDSSRSFTDCSWRSRTEWYLIEGLRPIFAGKTLKLLQIHET